MAKVDFSSIFLNLPSSKPAPATGVDAGYINNNTNWGEPQLGDIYKPDGTDSGVYGIKMITNNISDFKGEVRLWRTNIDDWGLPEDAGDGGYDVTGDPGVLPSQGGDYEICVNGFVIDSNWDGIIDGQYISVDKKALVDYKSGGHDPDSYAVIDASYINLRSKGDDEFVVVNGIYNLSIKDTNYQFEPLEEGSFMRVTMLNINGTGNWNLSFDDVQNVKITPDPGFPKTSELQPTYTGVFMEISWPISITYLLRRKRTYYFEVFDLDNI